MSGKVEILLQIIEQDEKLIGRLDAVAYFNFTFFVLITGSL